VNPKPNPIQSLHPNPETRNPNPETQNPNPETRNTQVGFYSVYLIADHVTVVTKNNDDKQMVHPQPQILKPKILNPKPQSLKPKPEPKTINPLPPTLTSERYTSTLNPTPQLSTLHLNSQPYT